MLRPAKVNILWVGSGDGSQQAAAVRSGHMNQCATFYDSRAEMIKKYPSALEALKYLESKGIEQHFSVGVVALGKGAGPLGCASK